MTKEVVKTAQSSITGKMSTDEIDLIKKTVAVGATDTELKMFLYQANRTGLDPLARQIYFLKRRVKNNRGGYDEKATIQSSIDGFRVVAERSGNYAGQDEPEFQEDTNGKPVLAKVKVYKFDSNGGRYVASVGVAYWKEYCPPTGQDFMWQKMPHTMIAKVAEALALRKAFPQDLSGLYTSEEMDQSGPESVKAEDVTPEQPQPEQLPTVSYEGGEPEDHTHELLVCEECGNDISTAEQSYSKRLYGRQLCRACQKLEKEKNNGNRN